MTGILQTIVALTEPAPPPPNWSDLRPTQRVRRLSGTAVEMFTALKRDFSVEDLLAARVFVSTTKGNPRLSPILAGESTLLFLARSQNGAPYDVVTQGGSIISDLPPAMCCSDDSETRRMIDGCHIVPVTLVPDDLVVLRQLRIPAIPFAALDQYVARSADQMFGIDKIVGGTSHSPSARPRCRYQIVILSWSISEFTAIRNASLTRLLAHLRDIEVAYHIDTGTHMRIWQPTAQQIPRFSAALGLREINQLREILLDSIVESNYSVRTLPHVSHLSDAALVVALTELADARDRFAKGFAAKERVEAATDRVKTAYQTQYVEKVTEFAESCVDPLHRAIALTAPPLMRRLYELGAVLPSGPLSARPQALSDGRAPAETTKEIVQIVDALTKVNRALVRNA